MFNVYYQVQKSACTQSLATAGRTDTELWMDYRSCTAKSVGDRAHLDPHTARKLGVRIPMDSTGSPPLLVKGHASRYWQADTQSRHVLKRKSYNITQVGLNEKQEKIYRY